MGAILLIPIFFLFGLACLLFWVWALVDAIKNPRLDSTTRLIWVLVILLANGIGALVYVLAGRNPGGYGRHP
ncbi:MAG: PLDc_N domain-containing protein [Phycisphaerales bacterium]|nr:PLDc_N domain-containing protein [Phycisphaerales bacterium]